MINDLVPETCTHVHSSSFSTHTHTHTHIHIHTHTVNSQTPPPLPTFTLHPAGGVYRNQTEVTLRCEASAATSLQWSHNGYLVTPDARRTIGTNTLTIVRLNNDVAGNYTCLASNDVGTITSAVAEVQIAGEIVDLHTYTLRTNGKILSCTQVRKSGLGTRLVTNNW